MRIVGNVVYVTCHYYAFKGMFYCVCQMKLNTADACVRPSNIENNY